MKWETVPQTRAKTTTQESQLPQWGVGESKDYLGTSPTKVSIQMTESENQYETSQATSDERKETE